MKITCKFCTAVLDVGDETRSIVALCNRTNKSCSVKEWANPKTRFDCLAEDDDTDKPTHVIQTNPPGDFDGVDRSVAPETPFDGVSIQTPTAAADYPTPKQLQE